MKTIKFIFSLLVSLMLVVPSWAQEETSALYVYAENVSALVGDEVELPIVLKNTCNVKSFEFVITIPSGVSFVEKGAGLKFTKVNEDISDWVITASNINGSTQVARILGYYVSGSDLSIKSGESTLLSLTLSADEDLVSEGAEIQITEQVFTDADGKEHPSIIPEGEEPEGAIIKPVTYSEGYSLQFLPQIIQDSEDNAIEFDIILSTPIEAKITSIDFDLVIDKTFYAKELWYANINASYPNGLNYTSLPTLTATGQHISIVSKKTTKFISNGNIANVGLVKESEEATISDGVYCISLKNIKVISNGNEISIEPYSGDIYVCPSTEEIPLAPINNGVVAFHGNYSDSDLFDILCSAVPTEAPQVTTLDLTAVTAVPCPGKSFTLANANALIRTNEDFQLTNKKNVVIGKICSNLELTDKNAFANTKKFTATNASYTRPMSDHTWATLCLPFAANMYGANIYTLKEISVSGSDTEDYGLMTFEMEATTTVAANKPYVIKKTANNAIFSASDTEVPVTPDVCSVKTDIDNWSLNGTTIDVNFATADLESHNYYFINSDAFWNASNSLHVAPFRAYFEYTQPEDAAPAKFRITEETNGIETIENEAEAGVIYDLQGRAVKAAQAGQIYVQGAKKFVVK